MHTHWLISKRFGCGVESGGHYSVTHMQCAQSVIGQVASECEIMKSKGSRAMWPRTVRSKRGWWVGGHRLAETVRGGGTREHTVQ